MASPSTSVSTLEPQLNTYLEGRFAELQEGFIASQVLPITEVPSKSGTFGKVVLEQILLDDVDTRRTPGSGYKRLTTQFTSDTYACEEHGIEEPVDDNDRAAYRRFLDAYEFAVDRAVAKILENAERRAAALLMNTTTYAGAAVSSAASNTWDNASGTPVSDVAAAKLEFFTATGYMPNTLVINAKVFDAMLLNSEVTGKITSSGAGESIKPGVITANQIAQACNIDRVLVAGGAKAGSTSGTATYVWPDYAFLCKVASTGDMREPCVGRTFHWVDDGSIYNGRVETYRDEPIRSDIVRVRHDVDEKLIHLEMGHLITNVHS